ncbi:hypothetical protein WJ83_20545 [Burkholderia ubonensis]|nr:hypothetical protein WJ83_20545 [Burkholderia ubonensis]
MILQQCTRHIRMNMLVRAHRGRSIVICLDAFPQSRASSLGHLADMLSQRKYLCGCRHDLIVAAIIAALMTCDLGICLADRRVHATIHRDDPGTYGLRLIAA